MYKAIVQYPELAAVETRTAQYMAPFVGYAQSSL